MIQMTPEAGVGAKFGDAGELQQLVINRYSRLDQLACPELIGEAQAGSTEALHTIWEGSIPLISSVVGQRRSPIPHDEKVQIACEEVPGVVERFDLSSNKVFSNLLVPRVRWSIVDAEIVLGEQYGLRRNTRRLIRKAIASDDPDKALEDLAKKPDKYGRFFEYLPFLVEKGSEGEWTHTISAPDSFGLETPELPDNNRTSVAQGTEGRIFDEQLLAVLATMDERERVAVVHKLGLFGAEVLYLNEIGDLFGVSESQAWRIAKAGIEKVAAGVNLEAWAA